MRTAPLVLATAALAACSRAVVPTHGTNAPSASPSATVASAPIRASPTAASAIGFRTSETRDPWTGAPLPVVFFYPAAGAVHRDPVRVGVYQIEAERNAPTADGGFPLVVVSHGHLSSMWGQHDLCEALARHGYVVTAAEHVGDTFRDQSAFRTDRMLLGRANQASAAIDAALADAALTAHVDPSRIGAAGFSAGGYTSLLLLGAQPDLTRGRAYCERHPKDDDFCGHGETAITRPSPPPTVDPRVRAAFVMAPLGVYFGDGAFDTVRAPVFLYWSTNDEVLLPSENAEVVRRRVHTLFDARDVAGAGHYVFLPPCEPDFASAAPKLCTDPPGIDRTALHAQIALDAVRFFDSTLRK